MTNWCCGTEDGDVGSKLDGLVRLEHELLVLGRHDDEQCHLDVCSALQHGSPSWCVRPGL